MDCKLLEIISRNSNIIYRLLKYSFDYWNDLGANDQYIEENRQTYCGISAKIILFFLSYNNEASLAIDHQKKNLEVYYRHKDELLTFNKNYEDLEIKLEQNKDIQNKYLYYFINIPESLGNRVAQDVTYYFPGHVFLIEQFNGNYKIYQSYMLTYELSQCPNFNQIFTYSDLIQKINPLKNILNGLAEGRWSEQSVNDWENLTNVYHGEFIESVVPVKDEYKYKIGMTFLEKDVCEEKFKNMSSNLESTCYKKFKPFLNDWIRIVSYHIKQNEVKILNSNIEYRNDFLQLNSNLDKSIYLKDKIDKLPVHLQRMFYFTRSFEIIKLNNYELIVNLLNIQTKINAISLNCNLGGGHSKIERYKIKYFVK